jgi:hypothetical protein
MELKMMYAKEIDGKIVRESKPRIKNVSSPNATILKESGWLPVVNEQPKVGETQRLVNKGLVLDGEVYRFDYEVVERDPEEIKAELIEQARQEAINKLFIEDYATLKSAFDGFKTTKLSETKEVKK